MATSNRSRNPEDLLERFRAQVIDQAAKAERIAERALFKGDKKVAKKATSMAKKLRTAAA